VSDPTPAALRDAAVAMARDAGAIVREGWGRAHRPERKGRIDLVTEYDRRSEALLLQRIESQFPGHAVLAEESGTHRHGDGRIRWLIDPLDGTTNFAHNYPFFAVSVGVEIEGVPAAAAIYDPTRDEMFAAAAGGGTTRNGEPVRVSKIERVEAALLVTGFPYDVREHPERSVPFFQAVLQRAQGVRRDGSAALNQCYVACGRFDGFFESSLSPWDMGAGVLLVREAGGLVTRYDGSAFVVDGKQILATNGRIHREMQEILKRT
jgi:myo-inositol-1(or 4)-monophosphatase